jgi:hypothetical protein
VNNAWFHWSPVHPPGTNTLTNINAYEGFWAHYALSERFCIAGYIEDANIQLHNGWNLVAYPFAARLTNTATIMAHLTANCPGYNGMLIEDVTLPYHLTTPTGTENIFHNQAFWVHVSADTTWTVLNY